jgi:hypothetical protein
MYFGCSLIARTYRDSWWDEAATSWYEMTYQTTFAVPAADFRTNIVSGRLPIAVGFDARAYREGAQVIEAMARQVGNRAGLTRFFSFLYQTRAFSPFTTMDLAEIFRLYSGYDISSSFKRWLYWGEGMGAVRPLTFGPENAPPDLTPPPALLEKYRMAAETKKGGRP